MKYESLINKMSLEEKARITVGKAFWDTHEVKRLGIPSIKVSDGPHGLRIQRENGDHLGRNNSEKAVCYPSASSIANSWDVECSYMLGKSLGEEAKAEGVHVVLGPAINIKRTPLCGRNFEYFSEDPFLTGKMAIGYIKGLQENGEGTCIKHFAANNQEDRRLVIDSEIDERALREIYLKAFEMAIKEAKPYSVMSAYNKLNGSYCTESKKLLVDILRKEWGFDGVVISDWGAENDRVKGIKAGNELEMPERDKSSKWDIINAVEEGRLDVKDLDECVDRLLDLIFKTVSDDVEIDEHDLDKHHDIAMKLEEESIVLLKNDDNILPLRNEGKIGIIGDMTRRPRYQGNGSSHINIYKLESSYHVFKEEGYNVSFSQGYNKVPTLEDDNVLLENAIEFAKSVDTVVIFAGLTDEYESEGIDRRDLDIPKNQERVIEEVARVNSNVIVVLAHGAPISMPWKESVKAIITGYLGGEAGERSMVNCIIGKVNPSGKLAETYPLCMEDTPSYNYQNENAFYSAYKESIYVGYRYFDTFNKDVLYPFGYGLSYTEFEYSNLDIVEEEDRFKILFDIQNVGNVKGKEIAEVYISKENSKIYRPNKELKAFGKYELEVGEKKKVELEISKDEFKYFDIEENKWKLEDGIYQIMVGKSIKEIVLDGKVYLFDIEENTKAYSYPEIYKNGDIQNISDEDFEKILKHKLPKKTIEASEITEENSIEQIRNTRAGKYIFDIDFSKAENAYNNYNVTLQIDKMANLQKSMRKLYLDHTRGITKDMVKHFIYRVKNDLEFKNCEFVKHFLGQEK